jgi:hypothetical protein
MATSVSSSDPGALTGGAFVATGGHDSAVAAPTFAGPDPDEDMLPAEQGAMGLVGPVTGAQHMPNAAQPGSTAIMGMPS